MKLLRYLKWLATLAFFLVFYPILAWVNFIFVREFTLPSGLTQLLAVILCGLLGYWAGWLFQNRLFQSNHLLGNVVQYGLCFLPVAVVSLLFSGSVLWLAIPLGILCSVSYLLGTTLVAKNYSDILTKSLLFTYIGTTLLLLLVVTLAQTDTVAIECNTSSLAAVFLVFLLVYGLVQNQGNIDYMMQRRKHRMEDLPKRIRYYNLFLVSLLLVLLVLGYVFRFQIADIFQAGFDLFKAGLSKLVAWLTRNQSSPAPAVTDSLQANPQVNPLFDKSQFLQRNSYHEYLWIAIFILLVGAIVYNRHSLVKLGQRIVQTVQRLLFQRQQIHQHVVTNEYYQDKETLLSPQKAVGQKSRPFNFKNWRKQYKNYLKMPPSSEKLRAGYRLILHWLSLKGFSPSPSATTLEIAEQAKTIISSDDYLPATFSYNKLRYGQSTDLSGLLDMDRTLASLEEKIK